MRREVIPNKQYYNFILPQNTLTLIIHKYLPVFGLFFSFDSRISSKEEKKFNDKSI